MYELASGTINVLEKKSFDKLDQERMINSPNKEQAFSVLLDTDLKIIPGQQSDIEEIIKQDLLTTRHALSKILTDNQKMLWFLFLRYDALNIKIALKKKMIQDRAVEAETFDFAINSYQDVEKVVHNFGRAGLPEINQYVYQIIETALGDLSKTKEGITSRRIEEIVDQVYFKVKRLIARDLGDFMEKVATEELVQAKQKKGKSILSSKIILQARDIGMGPAKVLAFIDKKMNGYNNIRLILFAKENNIEMSEIEPHLLPV